MCTQLLKNWVFCNSSMFDQALACLEQTTNFSCGWNKACVWSNRYFGVTPSNKSTIFMTALSRAINSLGWLKGPHDTDLYYNYNTASGIMPFSYCAARYVGYCR